MPKLSPSTSPFPAPQSLPHKFLSLVWGHALSCDSPVAPAPGALCTMLSVPHQGLPSLKVTVQHCSLWPQEEVGAELGPAHHQVFEVRAPRGPEAALLTPTSHRVSQDRDSSSPHTLLPGARRGTSGSHPHPSTVSSAPNCHEALSPFSSCNRR